MNCQSRYVFIKAVGNFSSALWRHPLQRPCPKSKLDHEFLSTLAGVNYVPKHSSPTEDELERLHAFVKSSKRLFVITGAGVSTESGIPDYRSEGTGIVARRPNFKPMNYQEFMQKERTRKIYWARSFAAWNYQIRREPNVTHYMLARWEEEGKVQKLVTQNVDQLHQKAGSKKVIELHGTLYQVRCMKCEYLLDRHKFQDMLRGLNKDVVHINFETKALRPDGDVELDPAAAAKFQLPPCPECGSNIMKPNVVFYGENVPTDRKEAVKAAIDSSDSVLVLGTTLHTRSGRDHIEYAFKLRLPIALLNIGPSYGDPWASIRINARCGEVMSFMASKNVIS